MEYISNELFQIIPINLCQSIMQSFSRRHLGFLPECNWVNSIWDAKWCSWTYGLLSCFCSVDFEEPTRDARSLTVNFVVTADSVIVVFSIQMRWRVTEEKDDQTVTYTWHLLSVCPYWQRVIPALLHFIRFLPLFPLLKEYWGSFSASKSKVWEQRVLYAVVIVKPPQAYLWYGILGLLYK